jgi:ubiquinone/menaquinone biosynthesis C-methylase UbiE
MNGKQITWEEAVLQLKSDTQRASLVSACYYDDPLTAAAERFAASEEWQAVCQILADWLPGKALDLGAGHGISSYALARHGCNVTAIEPDGSAVVGAAAIRRLALETGVTITVVQGQGETLPFADASFDIIYGRQVLHHAANLPHLCREAARVLRPGGILVATREHVISELSDLDTFLQSHPLHPLYGGENAFLLKQYQQAIREAGLLIKKTYGPFDSVINYFPLSKTEYQETIAGPLRKAVGKRLAARIASHAEVQRLVGRLRSWRSVAPGRLYSFVAIKPRII